MEGDNNSWDRFIAIDIFLSVGAQALEGIQRPKYSYFLFASELSCFHPHILASLSGGIRIFAELFFMGYQTKKSEKAKLVTSWLRLTMDYFPKYKNQNQILKTYRIYFDWPVWPQSDQS